MRRASDCPFAAAAPAIVIAPAIRHARARIILIIVNSSTVDQVEQELLHARIV
jgi:hypothetical protein